MKYKSTKSPIGNLSNQEVARLLCRFILQGKIMPPYKPLLLCKKQQQQKAKSKKEIKKQILLIFTEIEKLIKLYSPKDITTNHENIFFIKEWSTIVQNINVLPQLIDISSLLSFFNATEYDKQIRNLYVGEHFIAFYGFYNFISTFTNEAGMNYVTSLLTSEFLYSKNINRIVHATMFFLCDLWICCNLGLHDITKLAYKHNL